MAGAATPEGGGGGPGGGAGAGSHPLCQPPAKMAVPQLPLFVCRIQIPSGFWAASADALDYLCVVILLFTVDEGNGVAGEVLGGGRCAQLLAGVRSSGFLVSCRFGPGGLWRVGPPDLPGGGGQVGTPPDTGFPPAKHQFFDPN